MSSATRLIGDRVPSSVHAWDGLHYWMIFAILFPMHLAAAIFRRLMPAYWTSDAPHESILPEAWNASATTARMAFSG